MDLAYRNKLFKNTAIAGIVFFAVSMFLILYFGINKTIEIVNVAQDSVSAGKADEASEKALKNSLLFAQSGENTDYLCIPLKPKTDAEDIVIENHYMDSELVIMIDDGTESFYRANELSGNRKCITGGYFEPTSDGLMLKLNMDGVYEYRTILENNNLYISFLSPRELYDKIVVIDPCCGGADTGKVTDEGEDGAALAEKDITLDVAKKLRDILSESGIKAYYTRMDDVNPSEEARVRLANETHADMYIILAVDSNSDGAVYGVSAIYNDEYFIPGFGSIELADTLLSNVAMTTKNKALGLIKAPIEAYTLRHATVPASIINLGCITNRQEAVLLKREDYRQKLAEGIYAAINEAYEKEK